MPLLNAGLNGNELQVTFMPWYTGKFLPNGLYDAQKNNYYDTLTFPHLCALKPTMPQPSPVNSPAFVQAAKFVACDMSAIQTATGHTPASMQSCAAQTGINWAALQQCTNSGMGQQIMRGAEFANKIHSVLNRMMDRAPYMFLNGQMLVCPGYNWCTHTWVPGPGGHYMKKPLPKPGSFLTVVCSHLQPPPQACYAALGGAPQPAAMKPTPACENCNEVLPSGWAQQAAAGPPRALPLRAVYALGAAAACAALAAGLVLAWRRTRGAHGGKAAAADGRELLSLEEPDLPQD